MAGDHAKAWRITGIVVIGVLVLILALVVGSALSNQSGQVASESYPALKSGVARSAVEQDMAYDAVSGGAAPLVAPESTPDAGVSSDAGAGDVATGVDQMLIRSDDMQIEVDSVVAAVDKVKAAVAAAGGEITLLSVSAGTGGDDPRPMTAEEAYSITPASASITIRIPGGKLDALAKSIGGLGKVISTNSSTSDVTQEYVDLDARLTNLKAEEATLRSFLDRADKISDLISIEKELSRVRGEIEAMQAQLDYLSRQVKRATLNVYLTEPGPVIRPGGQDWGFVDAITSGIQGAAAVLRLLITGVIALLPVGAMVALVWAAIAAMRRSRRRHASGAGTAPDSDSTPGEDDR